MADIQAFGVNCLYGHCAVWTLLLYKSNGVISKSDGWPPTRPPPPEAKAQKLLIILADGLRHVISDNISLLQLLMNRSWIKIDLYNYDAKALDSTT